MIDLSDTAAVYARAREAYKRGELQAQKPEQDRPSYCSYAGPCAIGVSIPEELRDDLDYDLFQVEQNDKCFPGMSIHTLIKEKRVNGNALALGRLQKAHDDWIEFNDNPEAAEAEFVRVLGEY